MIKRNLAVMAAALRSPMRVAHEAETRTRASASAEVLKHVREALLSYFGSKDA